MGITLKAIVEIKTGEESRQPLRAEKWQTVASFRFEKDYPMMRAARELADGEGLPPNPSFEVEHGQPSGFSSYWMTGRDFDLIAEEMKERSGLPPLEKDEEPDEPTLQYHATAAFIKALHDRGCETRVVFWEM